MNTTQLVILWLVTIFIVVGLIVAAINLPPKKSGIKHLVFAAIVFGATAVYSSGSHPKTDKKKALRYILILAVLVGLASGILFYFVAPEKPRYFRGFSYRR